MKWEEGRLGSGYFKKKLAEWKFFDMYLLKFPKGISVPEHRDKVPNKRHYRLNILLKGTDTFKSENVIFKLGRIVLFRPDLSKHSLDQVPDNVYLFSLGIAI
jgi:hypothetical protein